MSVIPMQKVRLLVHHTDVDAALDIIQRSGALEFRETDMESRIAPAMAFKNAHLLARVQHAIHFLEPYEHKIGLWKSLREGTRITLTEEEIAKKLADTDAVEAVVSDLEKLQVEFADLNEKLRNVEEQYNLLNDWKNLPIKLSDLKTKTTVTLLLKGHQATEKNTLGDILLNLVTENQIPNVLTSVTAQLVAVTLPKDEEVVVKFKSLLETIDAEVIIAPQGLETPDVEFVAVSERLAKAKSELALAVDQTEHFAMSYLNSLRVAAEILSWQNERKSVIETANATKHTVIFDGWLNQMKKSEIEQDFADKKIAAVFSNLELSEGEEPPVDIVNSPMVEPFEAVTRLYGMPGYTDLDPTVFLAGFFFLFFGLSLTDVGYGLALVVASIFILTMCKVTRATRVFAKLLLFIGIGTVIVGAAFGGYFGASMDLMPEWLQKIQLFDPIGNPLPVFYLALALGVFQVMVGMALKIYSEARNKRLMDGIIDQGPWLFLFFVGILYVLVSIGYTSILSVEQIGNLSLVGAVMIFIAGARSEGNIFSRLISGLAGLYAGVGHFSDILSYSRLLALGLATSALAYAVNLIASMLSEVPYVGFLLSAIILIIGHLFTLAINTLGAFVHSARLQFVEFFGKFITGTGKEFTPLRRKKKYITIGDD